MLGQFYTNVLGNFKLLSEPKTATILKLPSMIILFITKLH